MDMKYEEAFTLFIDFLGFSEASEKLDNVARFQVLQLLLSLVTLRSEFSAATTDEPDGSVRHYIRPAISTFSDNIVISYGLETLKATNKIAEEHLPFFILGQAMRIVSTIAANALRLGFLIRGGAAIGKLYHARGVVFGEVLPMAVQLEKRTAIYPRIALSPSVVRRSAWIESGLFVVRDEDGVYCFDYINHMLLNAALPGELYLANLKQWFDQVVAVIGSNLLELKQRERINELAKWAWFANRFRQAMKGLPAADMMKHAGISTNEISWGEHQRSARVGD